MKRGKNKIDIAIEILCLGSLIGVTAYLVFNWAAIPEKVPMHYNAAGVIDRWGSKSELAFVPGMAWFLYLMVTAIQQFPAMWNTGVRVTEENKGRVYRNLSYMLGTTKLLMVVAFSTLTIFSLLGKSLPSGYLFIELGLIFGNLIFWLIKLYKEQ